MFWLDGAQIGSYVFDSVDNPSIGFKGVSMNPIVAGNECGIEGQLLDNGLRLHLWAGSNYNGVCIVCIVTGHLGDSVCTTV